jgi:hypothetical protein
MLAIRGSLFSACSSNRWQLDDPVGCRTGPQALRLLAFAQGVGSKPKLDHTDSLLSEKEHLLARRATVHDGTNFQWARTLMRAIIRDEGAIGALRPLNVVGYLRSHGWQKYSEVSGKFSVWNHPSYPDAEIVVPLRREASDFMERLSDILHELEAAEKRSPFDILRDLLNSGFDVVRLGAASAATVDGTISIVDGLKLFEQSKEMLLCAACSTINPRAVFHSRKPQRANDYMATARFGQTEQGSYVLTLLSPIAPQLNAHGDTELFPPEPFERQVIRTLARAVNCTVVAAERAATAPIPDFAPFSRGRQSGRKRQYV